MKRISVMGTFLQDRSKYEKSNGVNNWYKYSSRDTDDYFDVKKHTFEEIVQAMCQAEIVHETIAVLSFVPLFTVPVFGSFWVFLITSILAACLDLTFVMMQRYNRPRIIKMIKN